jgi:hypothetical protein
MNRRTTRVSKTSIYPSVLFSLAGLPVTTRRTQNPLDSITDVFCSCPTSVNQPADLDPRIDFLAGTVAGKPAP